MERINVFKQTIIKFATVFCFIMGTFLYITGVRAEAQDKEMTLYVVDPKWEKLNSGYDLNIPAAYPQKGELPAKGYTIKEGSSVTLEEEDTAIEPTLFLEYGKQSQSGYWMWSTWPMDGYTMTRETYHFEDTVFVSENGKDTVTVHVKDYADVIAQNVMKEYLDKNIKAGMTSYEIAEVCCKFVASYDYGTEYTSYTGMIFSGAGDCFASTNSLIWMLEYLGHYAVEKYAGNEPGAGVNHYNVLAKINDKYYTLDAGMEGTAPRDYVIVEASSPFRYTLNENAETGEKEAIINAYINVTKETKVEVPAYIDGYKVVGLSSAFSGDTIVKEVILPDTLKSIGSSAFNEARSLEKIVIPNSVTYLGDTAFRMCDSLKSINIPASVKQIKKGCFVYTKSLKEINVAEDNAVYCSKDGVLYNKGVTRLIAYPAGKEATSYTIPDGVKTIASWAFLAVNKTNGSVLTELNLPDGLETVESEAFYICDCIKKLELPSSMSEIKEHAFDNCQIEEIYIPGSVKKIGKYAFRQAGVKILTLSEGIEEIEEGAFMGCFYVPPFVIPQSVKKVGDYAFNYAAGYPTMPNEWEEYGYWSYVRVMSSDTEFGEHVFDEDGHYLLYVVENSTAHKYATDNQLPFKLFGVNDKFHITDEWLALADEDDYFSTGKPIIPRWGFTDKSPNVIMFEGVDYEVYLENNINPGLATLTVVGKGMFEGTAKINFKIIGTVSLDPNYKYNYNLNDAKLCLKLALGIEKMPYYYVQAEEYMCKYDADKNNQINLNDAKEILKYALGISTPKA